MDILNPLFALFSIVLGVYGWLFPRYTLTVVDLQAGTTTMGYSEIRASAGALFPTAVAIGKFQGLILATTPTGSRRVSISIPGLTESARSSIWRCTSAAK